MEKEGDNVAVMILLLRPVDPYLIADGDRIATLAEAANLWSKCRI